MILETYYSYIDDAHVYCRQQQKVDSYLIIHRPLLYEDRICQ